MKTALRLLIVEDSEDDIELILRELRRGGFDPTCARVDTAAAMSAALTEQAWDVVIADYHLPRFSAVAALEVLHKSGLDLPFIIVSGVIGEDVAVEAMRLGAHDYVMKDRLARLAPAIKRELRDAAERRRRRQTEEAMLRSEAYLRAMMENVSDGIITFDERGIVESFNPQARRLFGYEPSEIIGSNFKVLMSEAYHREYDTYLTYCVDSDREKSVAFGPREVVGKRKDGGLVPMELTISAMQLDKERRLIASVRDITERKRREQMILAGLAEQRRLHQALHQQVEELKCSRQRIVSAEESLRKEIAELLHGTVQTRLLVVCHHLAQCQRLLDTDISQARILLSQIRDEIDQIREREVRQASHLLHPSIISVGLIPAVRSLAGRFEEYFSITIHVEEKVAAIDGPSKKRIPQSVSLAAYRVLEEGLNNIYRHAEARKVEIRLGLSGEENLEIVLEDDGRGFEVGEVKGGLGLVSISDRVGAVGGSWSIKSKIGEGTKLSICLPLKLRESHPLPSRERMEVRGEPLLPGYVPHHNA